MIRLLLDAVIAVATKLRGLTTLSVLPDAAHLQGHSPGPVVGAPPAGTGSPVQATSAGGHLTNSHAEPLRWGFTD